MTSNTDGAAQGEWEYGSSWIQGRLAYDLWERDPDRHIATVFSESDVTSIIADHRKAQMADVLAKALESNVRLSHLKTFPHVKPTKWEQMALDALATDHAATEEATR